jgi:hypothetical protein
VVKDLELWVKTLWENTKEKSLKLLKPELEVDESH